jgi:hypothetical protein
MSEANSIQWRRISVEAAAIIASILLAFAIDAWWQDRQQQQETEILLQEFLQDLNDGKNFVVDYRSMAIAIRDAAETLLSHVSSPTSELSDDEGYRLVWQLGFFADVDVMPMGSINVLLTDGRIGQIRSVQLRRLVADLPDVLEYARFNLRADYDFQANFWTPYMVEHANMTQIAQGSTGHVPGLPHVSWPKAESLAGMPVPVSELLNHREFMNLLSRSIDLQILNLVVYGELEAIFDETIGLVEAEILAMAAR